MLKGIKFLICFTTLLLLINSAFAAIPLPAGWYLEGNIGESVATKRSYGTGTSISNTGFGWNVNAGYKFMPFFAGEIGVTDYWRTTVKNAFGTVAMKDSHYSADLAGKFILPVSDSGFELFAKLGAAYIRSNLSISNSTAYALILNPPASGRRNAVGYYFGLGAQYYFNPSLAANLQWQRAKGNSGTGTLDLYSIGLSYLFCY